MRAQVERWLSALGRAWEAADADLAASLFAEEVEYRENPFDPPICGRAAVRGYWLESLATQRDVRFSGEVLAVEGDTAVVHWVAEFERVPSGERVRLDGVSAGRFDPQGRPALWREWWHKVEGA